MGGPRITSGRDSEQIVCTPRDFLDPVEARFGKMAFDLAATRENNVVGDRTGNSHFGPGSEFSDDALTVDWIGLAGNLWLNPPYANIKEWARKCAGDILPYAMAGYCRIFLFVPLTTANWACDYVHGKALVLGIVPRITFVGHETAYPRDMMLAVYGEPPGFEIWQWKERRKRRIRNESRTGSGSRIVVAGGAEDEGGGSAELRQLPIAPVRR